LQLVAPRSADDVSRVLDAGGEECRVVGEAVALLRAEFANASIKGPRGACSLPGRMANQPILLSDHDSS
jgi:hypothetical protein